MVETFEQVGWQRRLRNTTVADNHRLGGWSKWTEVDEDLAKYAIEFKTAEGFPELVAEARPIYASPSTQNTRLQYSLKDSPEIVEFLRGVIGTCEATRNEHHMLWQLHHHDAEKFDYTKLSWKSGLGGYLITVGSTFGEPVCISINADIVDGHKILFYHATSNIVDHTMIRSWLDAVMPKTAFRKDGYLNNTDATNFTNILPMKERVSV